MKPITLFLLAIAFASLASGQNYVTLYEDCNFFGRSFTLTPGNYRAEQMKVANDRLSCINIPYGMRVTIYEHNNFSGRSQTYNSTVPCLPSEWNDAASSIVVESDLRPGEDPNAFVTFYNDCNSRGFSKSLRAGTYTGSELGVLRQNISSFTITGNLRVRAYTSSDNASGYYVNFDQSQYCLSSVYNDKIRSLVIEYRVGNDGGGNNDPGDGFANLYMDCNYGGNSLRLGPGNYSGYDLGMFRGNISSVQLPSNFEIRAYVNSDNTSGNYYTISSSSNCLSGSLNDQIRSITISRTGYGGNNPPSGSQVVIIYTNEEYRGQSVSLLPGTYATMAQIGFPDKALSSLTVPEGYRVVIYDQPNFGGKSYTITQSKSKFYLSGWNDKTSSIAVYRDR